MTQSKYAPCPRCGTNGRIKFEYGFKCYMFACLSWACGFACKARDLKLNYDKYKETSR